jgi:hypothetical protein
MSIQGQVAVQLLSEPKLVAVCDFLGTESRNGNNGTEYHSLKAVVGNSTQSFDIEPILVGQAKTFKKYSRVLIEFEEFTFRNSGNTVKKALALTLVE